MSEQARCARLARHRVARRGLAVERQPQDLADRRVGILRRRHALAIADRQEQVLAVGRKGDLGAELTTTPLRHVTPQHLQSLEARRVLAQGQPGPCQGQARCPLLGARLGIGEVDAVIGRVMRRHEHAQHAALTLPQDRRDVVDGRLLPLLRHQPDRTDLLGDEHASIRQEGNAPGQFELRHLSHRERQARFRLQRARVDLRARRGRSQSQ